MLTWNKDKRQGSSLDAEMDLYWSSYSPASSLPDDPNVFTSNMAAQS